MKRYTLKVKLPEILKLAIVEVILLNALLVNPEGDSVPTDTEPALSVPLPEIVASASKPPVKCLTDTAPETVRVCPELTVSVPVVPVKVTEPAAASAVTVTVCPV